MKYSLEAIRLDLSRGNVVETDIREPGIVRQLFTLVEEPSLILARPGGEQQKPKLWPCLLVEVDPDAPTRRRRFIALGGGMQVDSRELGADALTFVAVLAHPTGATLAIYEAPVGLDLPTAEAPAPRNGIAPD